MYITIGRIAEVVGKSRITVNKWYHQGKLPKALLVKDAQRVYPVFDEDDVEEWVEGL